MFKINPEAEKYIADLLKEQDEPDLAIRIDVESAGTPSAMVRFNFCMKNELSEEFEHFPYEGFSVYVHKKNKKYLKESEVSLVKDEYLMQKLTISTPHAKGKPPEKNAPLEERLKYFLAAEISPKLASHGGAVELVEITDKKVAILNFKGGCQGCSSVEYTLKEGIEKQVRDNFPEIQSIADVTDHSYRDNAYYK